MKLPTRRKVSENVLNAVGVTMDDAKQLFLDAVKKEAKDQVAKILEESKGYVRAATPNRQIYRSRFTEQELLNSKMAKTPLGSFSGMNPRAAALSPELKLENVLDPISLSETADAFFADGIMRRVWLDNKGSLPEDIRSEFKELEKPQIAEYHIRVSKLLENLSFYDNQIKLLATSMIFGRNGLLIKKIEDSKFPKYGKPSSLVLLNPLSIKKALIDNSNEHSFRFNGFQYDFGVKDQTDVPIDRINLIPFFYDDWNIYKNTYYSGLTRVFSLVGLAHSNQLINDYDIPEATQSVYTGNNYVYVGSESNLLVDQFTNSHQRGIVYHDKPALHVEAAQASGKIVEIMQTREYNYETICMILGIPLFLILEKSANFATAAISMQTFINGRVKRLSTRLGDTFEEYFLLPVLCDICKIDLEEFQKVYVNRVKAVMPSVTLETKTDRIDNAMKLWSATPPLITDRVSFFKYIGEDQLAELAEPLDQLEEQIQKEDQRADIDEIMANEDMMQRTGRKLLTDFNVKASPSEKGIKDTMPKSMD